MSEDKKNETLIGGKPVSEINAEELLDALNKGEVELAQRKGPTAEDVFDLKRLEQFILGDITWAQLMCITMDEAYDIAEYGYSLYKEGRFHDSRVIFEGLVMANPYDAYFHCMLGSVYQQLDLKEEASEEYSTAIELDEEHLHAYVNRGEIRLENGEVKLAIKDLATALKLDPEGKEEAGLRARVLATACARALESLTEGG